MNPTLFFTMQSPVGDLLLTSDGRALTGVYMEKHKRGPAIGPGWRESRECFASARAQLDEYFAGNRVRFDLELAPHGTPFQRATWEALRGIPFGATETYGALAARLGAPKASRSVGAANARNPLSIIVPCHRVVGASGALTGYAGGVERKRWLLEHESRGLAAGAVRRGAWR